MKPSQAAAGPFTINVLLLAASLIFPTDTALALGGTQYVEFQTAPGSFAAAGTAPANIVVDAADWPCVPPRGP